MARNRRRHQVVLQLMPGAEPWVRVEHCSGWFKVPLFTCLEEVLEGVERGWSGNRGAPAGEATVRVPLSQWLARLDGSGRRP